MDAMYCNFDEAARELKAVVTDDTETDAQVLKERIRFVSRRIDLEMSPEGDPYFVPTIKTRTMPLTQSRVKDGGLSYQTTFPLLEATATSLKYRTQSTPYTDYVEVEGNRLYWSGRGAGWQELYNRHRTASYVVVSGVWGYHHDYANAWADGDITTEAINDNQTDIPVEDIAILDPYMVGLRYSYGTLIRIEDEMMLVLGLDASTNTLTVARGVNGSTAVAHLTDLPVEVFQVEDPIRRVTARQAALLYARRGAFESQTIDGFGVTTYPQDLLMELRTTLGRYQFGG